MHLHVHMLSQQGYTYHTYGLTKQPQYTLTVDPTAPGGPDDPTGPGSPWKQVHSQQLFVILSLHALNMVKGDYIAQTERR